LCRMFKCPGLRGLAFFANAREWVLWCYPRDIVRMAANLA